MDESHRGATIFARTSARDRVASAVLPAAVMRGTSTIIVATLLTGCFHYVRVPDAQLPTWDPRGADTRVITDEGPVDVANTALNYPTLSGDVPDSTDTIRRPPRYSVDVRTVRAVEVRRVEPGRTSAIVIGVTLGVALVGAIAFGAAIATFHR